MGEGQVDTKCQEKYVAGFVRRVCESKTKSRAQQIMVKRSGRGIWIVSREAGQNE